MSRWGTFSLRRKIGTSIVLALLFFVAVNLWFWLLLVSLSLTVTPHS